ncbi:hypothetical protein T07_725 [Trichinella nelsoni]|uniref:Uncharacterized protein n=1 Tax=Trichinella nelsoni TaxID=6336 RepID=A0A0V0SHP5_9BILA|nr:hypothetical protein T07_725 [Trichinella nelsoni]
MYAVDLQIRRLSSLMRFHTIAVVMTTTKDERKGGTVNRRLVSGSTGPVIPDAWPRLLNWTCRMFAFMLAQSNTA